MQTSQILQAWGKILKGEHPSLSIEITRECPLRCPGCYAFDDAHLGGGQTLRDLNDRKGQFLVDGVLEVVDDLKPLHLSIVGGDPLVRYRELESRSAVTGPRHPRADCDQRFPKNEPRLGASAKPAHRRLH